MLLPIEKGTTSIFKRLLPENGSSQGRNLSLTVVYVPYSFWQDVRHTFYHSVCGIPLPLPSEEGTAENVSRTFV